MPIQNTKYPNLQEIGNQAGKEANAIFPPEKYPFLYPYLKLNIVANKIQQSIPDQVGQYLDKYYVKVFDVITLVERWINASNDAKNIMDVYKQLKVKINNAKCPIVIAYDLNLIFYKIAKQRILKIELDAHKNHTEVGYNQRTNEFLNTGRSHFAMFTTASKDIYDRIHVDRDYYGAMIAYDKEDKKLREAIDDLYWKERDIEQSRKNR